MVVVVIWELENVVIVAQIGNCNLKIVDWQCIDYINTIGSLGNSRYGSVILLNKNEY